MSKKIATDEKIAKAMKTLGKRIHNYRGELSLRKLADNISISATQLLAIENGTLAPTAEVYDELIKAFNPSGKKRQELDQLYMTIRKVPPPDICTMIINNPLLIEAMRTINGKTLEKNQVEEIKMLLTSFAEKDT